MKNNSTRFPIVRIDDSSDAANSAGQPVRPDARDAELLDAYSQAVVNVVEKVSPAVISVTGRRDDAQAGSGSGFVIAPDGYAVTNSHVVAGRSRLIAETTENDRVDAEVIGDDPATDLALVRLASRDLPYAEIGDSDALRVGQLVIAMGSPLGLHATISTGVVSAVGRSMRGQNGRLIENIVQHSAPINPGNSGGPLVDSRGRVVGVNTAIVAFAQGLGFAVPGNTARWVVSEVLAHGKVRRRQLGIVATVRNVPHRLVRELDLLSDQAVEVVEVVENSPADAADIRPGDLIVALNDRVVSSVDDLHRLLALFPIAAPLELTLVRNGGKRHIPIAHTAGGTP
jgi:S1-C subfamily serine protease